MCRRSERGWTLTELVVVVGIIGLMAAMAVPSLTRAVDSYRLSQAVTLLSGAIREAQVQSLRESRPWRVLVYPDGSGFSLQYRDDPAASTTDCTGAGWTTRKEESFSGSLRVDTSALTMYCLAFVSNGRPDWPIPRPLMDFSNPPRSDRWYPLSDGVILSDPMPTINPLSDERTAVWRRLDAPVPEVVFDMGGDRFVGDLVLGLYSKPNYYKYPTQIKVEGTTLFDLDSNNQPVPPGDPGAWVIIYNQPGPSTPPSGQHSTTVTIPVDDAYRFFRLTFTVDPSSYYMVLHEISFGEPSFIVTGPTGARRLVVNSVTGMITVERVNS
ncbi:MAG: pilus assembly FimT family protein [Bacillota bacterium]